jgi:hypothetical protein
MDVNLDALVADVRRRNPDAGPLGHLADAVVAARRLEELADRLIGHFVDEARGVGASWTEIGQSLGVTKQAAQKRFVVRGASAALARFTEPARRAIIASQDEARRTGQARVGSEHIVLGILTEPRSLAARAVEAQGVPLDAARSKLAHALGPPVEDVPDHIPYSADAKKVRELALREARRLGHALIGTDDLLLAVLRDGRGPAARGLSTLGVHRDRTERCLREFARAGEPRE